MDNGGELTMGLPKKRHRIPLWAVLFILVFVGLPCTIMAVALYSQSDYYFLPLEPEEYDHRCWPFLLPSDLPGGVEPTPQVFVGGDSLDLRVEYTCLVNGKDYKLRMFMRGSCEGSEVEGTLLSWRVESSRPIKNGVYETVVYVSIDNEQSSASYRIVSPYSITQTLQIVESLEPASP
jgi:hypothetical protein